MTELIPISVLVATLNEENNLPQCLQNLTDFDEVVIIDSGSIDKTIEIAAQYKAKIISYVWNKKYPKKRQWCLDTLNLKHDRVFFVDADEVLTPELVDEIRSLSWSCAGYFVKGQYYWQGGVLKHGLCNNKLCLFDRTKIQFPEVNDLESLEMGEMEGHYQPVLKSEYITDTIGQLDNFLIHYAEGDCQKIDYFKWLNRHKRYAEWEAMMIKKNAYPVDPVVSRQILKRIFRKMPCRGFIAFLHCYGIRLGFLDGVRGLDFALSRWRYYHMVAQCRAVAKRV